MKKFLYLFFVGILLLFSNADVKAYAYPDNGANKFMFTVNPFLEGKSESGKFEILTHPDENYSYTVEWGDGSVETNVTGDISHTYNNAKQQYQIRISGNFPGMFSSKNMTSDMITDAGKIISLDGWGNIVWKNMTGMFFGAKNMTANYTDTPNVSSVKNMSFAFAGAEKFSGNLDNWDTVNVENLHAFLSGATIFNGSLAGWNVTNVRDMSFAFAGAENFNQDISDWDTRSVQNMNSMFEGAKNFSSNIAHWNTQSLTTMKNIFKNATAFNSPVNNWNTRFVEDFSGAFYGALSFNQPLDKWNTEKGKYFQDFLYNAQSYNSQFFGNNWDLGQATNLKNFYTNTKISVETYKNFLKYIITQPLQTGVELSFFDTGSCDIFPEKTAIIEKFSWNILDSSNDCNGEIVIHTEIHQKIFNEKNFPTIISGKGPKNADIKIYHKNEIIYSAKTSSEGNFQFSPNFIKSEGKNSIIFEFWRNGAKNSEKIIEFTYDSVPPEIILLGQTEVMLSKGQIFSELGYQCTDATGNCRVEIIGNNFNANIPGVYNIEYIARDDAENISKKLRTVKIVENNPPRNPTNPTNPTNPSNPSKNPNISIIGPGGTVNIKNENNTLEEKCEWKNVEKGISLSLKNLSETITRIDFLQLLMNAKTCQKNFSSKNTKGFNDISPYSQYYDFVAYAQEKGWVEGFQDGNFHPLKKITRDEAAKMIFFMLEKPKIENLDLIPEDVKEKNEFTESIQFVIAKNYIPKISKNIFAPKDEILKSQVYTILQIIFGK